MTCVASILLSADDARRLRDAAGEDPVLASLAVDVSEERGGWRFSLYLDDVAEGDCWAALGRLARSVLGRRVNFTVAELPDIDWVAKSLEGLAPVRAGRFLVHGAHDRSRRMANDIAIEVEAGQAFGTGHHGTTAACLVAIDRIVRSRPVTNALDVGTGSGVLAIAIAKSARVPVLASDSDPVAVRVARGNVALNGVARLATVVTASDVRRGIFRERAPFDLVVANILARPLIELAPAIARLLARRGSIVLSGLLVEQAARVAAAYRAQGAVLERRIVREGWATLICRRR